MKAKPATLPDLAAATEVLVIKPSSFGDIVHTLPAVALLKRQWPHLALRWIVNTEWAPLLEGSSLLTGIVRFHRARYRGPLRGLRALPWFWGLRHLRPDVALDFQGLFRSALMGRASRAGSVIGLSDARETAARFYSQTVKVDADAHAVDRYLALVRALGAGGEPPATADSLPAGSRPNMSVPERFILLHPFARGAGKSLDVAQISALTQFLAPESVVIAGVSDRRLPPSLPSNGIDLTNQTTLEELIWLMRQAAFVISVDSGPMHLASALNRPLLGIHTWSDPRKVGPYADTARVWKGGTIAPRNDIDEALALRHDLPDNDDLAAIAAHAHFALSG